MKVLVADARAAASFFITAGDRITGIPDHVLKVIADPLVKIKVMIENCAEALPVSPIGSPACRFIKASIRNAFPGVLVAPGIAAPQRIAATTSA